MSDATTALAEVLDGHRVGMAHIVDERALDDSGWLTSCNLELRCSCGTTIKAADDADPDVWALHRAHVSAAVVAAIRGLSPDLQAELLGAGARVERDPPGIYQTALQESRRRVVGPWTPEQAEEAS